MKSNDRVVVVRTIAPDVFVYAITGGPTETLDEARENAAIFTSALGARAIHDEAIAAGALIVGESAR